MNKREETRKRVRMTLSAEPGSIRAYTGDLSKGGLFIVTTKVLPPGTRVRINLQSKVGPALGVGIVKWAKRVPAQIIRDARGGMGIEFTWMSPELKKLIDDYLA